MDLAVEKHLVTILQEENYRLLLQKQLAKDFANAGLDLGEDFQSVTLSLTELFTIVREELLRQLEKGERQTLTLMYSVDIPEKAFLKVLHEKDVPGILAQLIIEREAQKIYFRIKYSGDK